MDNQKAIEELKYQEAMRSNGADYQVNNLVIGAAISALEKQIPKKAVLCMNEKSGMFVDYADGHGEYKTQMNNWWRCPHCNEVVGKRVIAHKHIHDQRKKNFCEKCGQAIDWSKE